MLHFQKVIVSIVFLLSFYFTITAQETSYYTEKNEHLKKGLNLVDQKLYAPAQLEFKLLKSEVKEATDNEQYTLNMFADFYYAYCAAMLDDISTELLFTRFIENYHETTLRNKAYFELGSYYFRNNKSADAIKWYEKVDTKELTNDELIEYKFNLGYTYFKKKEFAEAKPLFKAIKDSKNAYAEPSTYYYGFISFYEENYKEAEKSFLSLKDSKLYKDAVPYYLTQIYFLRHEYQKVIDYAAPLLKNPKTENIEEIAHIVGQAYFELEDYENAVPLLEAYIDNTKKVTKEELYQLAYAQYKTGNYSDAVNNFQELNVVEDSLGQNAMYCLADCYLKTNDKQKAKFAFSQAASMDFDPLVKEVAMFQTAKLNYELGQTNEAINGLSNFLDKYPNSSYRNEAGNILSEALVETKNFGKAIDILEKYNVSGPSVDKVYQMVTYYKAVELYNDKKYDEALYTVNKSLTKPIDNDILGLSYFLKGNIQYEKDAYADAASNFTKFKQFNIKDTYAQSFATKSMANYNIAYCYFKQKNYGDASNFFNETIKNATAINAVNPTIIPDAFLRNADCLFMVKSYTKAIQHYDEVINKGWQGAEYALVQKSVINGLQGNYADKVYTLEYLNTQYPNNIYKDYALYEMGVAYISASDYTKAISKLNDLVNKYPSSKYVPDAYLKLGLTYFNTGQEEKALTAYKKVVIDYPNSEQAKEALVALKELYVYLGRTNDYVAFLQQSGINVSKSEQDDLMFEALDNQYMGGNCAKTVPSASEYISLFPKGNHIVNAYYYRADCLFKAKTYDGALADYDKLVSLGTHQYLEEALLKATYISYEINGNFSKSLGYYSQLNSVASVQSNKDIALIGMMRCNFKLKNYNEVLKQSTEVLANASISQEVKTEATFYKAKALMENGKFNEAEPYFTQLVDNLSMSVIKAESAYNLALILNKKHLYEASNNACFKIKNEYASYDYWVVKTFILIADNYVMLDNTFQAKATLQSIIDNYHGDQGLIDEAQNKLDQIKANELKNTKIDFTGETDTIQFDTNK